MASIVEAMPAMVCAMDEKPWLVVPMVLAQFAASSMAALAWRMASTRSSADASEVRGGSAPAQPVLTPGAAVAAAARRRRGRAADCQLRGSTSAAVPVPRSRRQAASAIRRVHELSRYGCGSKPAERADRAGSFSHFQSQYFSRPIVVADASNARAALLLPRKSAKTTRRSHRQGRGTDVAHTCAWLTFI